MLGLNQLLTLFLLGVTSSVSNACELTLLQAETLNNPKPNIPASLQLHAFSPSEGGKNELDTKTTFDSSIKTAQSLTPSFSSIDWSTVAPSPIARSEAAGVAVDGNLYVFGGYIKSTVKPFTRPISRADVYNPTNNTWNRIKDLPNPLTHTGTAVDGRDIYLAGGYPGKPTGGQSFATRNVWKYNVDTNTWVAMPSLPEARGSGELALLGRELHFFGGVDANRVDKEHHWVLSLDGGTSWTPAAPLPNPRSHLGDAVIDGKIYAIGGQQGTDQNLVTQDSVHMWNPAYPDTWTTVASLPRARSHISAATFVMDNRIIVAGGEVSHGISVSDVTAYEPLSDTWTVLTPLPAPRHSGVAGNIGEQIFYTTGNNRGMQSTTYKGVPVLIFPATFSDAGIAPDSQGTTLGLLTN